MPKQNHWTTAVLLFLGLWIMPQAHAVENTNIQNANAVAGKAAIEKNKAAEQNNAAKTSQLLATQAQTLPAAAAKTMAQEHKMDVAKPAIKSGKTTAAVNQLQKPVGESKAPGIAAVNPQTGTVSKTPQAAMSSAKPAEVKTTPQNASVKPKVEAISKNVEALKPVSKPEESKKTQQNAVTEIKPEAAKKSPEAATPAPKTEAETKPSVTKAETTAIAMTPEQSSLSFIEAFLSLILGAVFLLVLIRGNIFPHHESP